MGKSDAEAKAQGIEQANDTKQSNSLAKKANRFEIEAFRKPY